MVSVKMRTKTVMWDQSVQGRTPGQALRAGARLQEALQLEDQVVGTWRALWLCPQHDRAR